MALVIRALHAASAPDLLNEEFLIVENTGPGLINAKGCTLLIGKRGQRPRALGTLDPGFVLKAGEKARLITGSPAKKAWGTPPAEGDARNYFLFLREPWLRPGAEISIAMKQLEMARARFAPDGKDGLEQT